MSTNAMETCVITIPVATIRSGLTCAFAILVSLEMDSIALVKTF